jgi:uncharacterized protein
MTDFVDRRREFRDLDRVAAAREAQFVMVYGRRRVGKTTLLTTWARQSGLPVLYWVAKREGRLPLMANLVEGIQAWERGGQPSGIGLRPSDWDAVLGELARVAGKRKCIVILDELPYLIESDPAFLSYLQSAWDHKLKGTAIRLLVSGSHIGMMTRLVEYQAPLYGRFTGQLPLEPLTFTDIEPFVPGYDVHKRLAVYSVLGGVPAYLERWRSEESLSANIERLFFQRTGWFRNEPMVLVSDLTRRETEGYEAILRAIAAGHHIREEIAQTVELPSTSLSHYLPRLCEMGLVQRRIPATVPPDRRRSSRESRYVLSDPYLRFYYRFVDPNLHMIEQGLAPALWQRIEEQFRAFVADSFEELCRRWTLAMARRGHLPLEPEVIGSHWSRDAQVDVVAVDWKQRHILLGEAKWGAGKVGREVIRDLVDKAPRVVPAGGRKFKVLYAFFARDGFTEAARAEATRHGALLRTLKEMEPELRDE